ncbi:hypothetical protein C8R47DRAFT_1197356 [Mycena vitilis]|nr:hypothetical protein C8R47DRAFT_1197356 [Mycena vitilis]
MQGRRMEEGWRSAEPACAGRTGVGTRKSGRSLVGPFEFHDARTVEGKVSGRDRERMIQGGEMKEFEGCPSTTFHSQGFGSHDAADQWGSQALWGRSSKLRRVEEFVVHKGDTSYLIVEFAAGIPGVPSRCVGKGGQEGQQKERREEGGITSSPPTCVQSKRYYPSFKFEVPPLNIYTAIRSRHYQPRANSVALYSLIQSHSINPASTSAEYHAPPPSTSLVPKQKIPPPSPSRAHDIWGQIQFSFGGIKIEINDEIRTGAVAVAGLCIRVAQRKRGSREENNFEKGDGDFAGTSTRTQTTTRTKPLGWQARRVPMHDDPYFWFNVARGIPGTCRTTAAELEISLIPPDIRLRSCRSQPSKRITGAHDGADDQLRTICRSASTATEAQLAQSHEKWMGNIWKSRADEMPSFPRLNSRPEGVATCRRTNGEIKKEKRPRSK